MRSARSIRMPTLLICFPNGDEPQKRRGDWHWSPCCKRWRTSPTAKRLRWCGDGWIGNMRCPCRWMIRALTPASLWTFGSACSPMVRRIACWNLCCGCVEGLIGWRDGPAVESAERVISPYETDARASRKRETEWVGYKVHLTETCGEEDAVHLIMQAELTPATEQDVEETMPLLDDLQARDLVPEVRLVDSGYVSGAVLPKHPAPGLQSLGPP